MMSEDKKSNLMDYVTGNFEHLEELTEQYRERKKNLKQKDPIFKEEIEEQYKEHIRYLICLEISRDTGCSYEDAILLYEDINLGDIFD